MWDYSEKVMDHYRNPRNVGKIDNADAIGEAGSLACGDSLKIYLKIENGIVTDAKFQTFGCGSAVASSSILTEMIIGKPIEEVKKITNKDIAEQLDGLPPEKMHCSVMGHEALEDALKNYFNDEMEIAFGEEKQDKLVCQCFDVHESQILEAIKTKSQDADKPKLTQTQKILKINSIIENQISSELQKDGGDIELVDIEGDKVYVKLRGKCSGCKNSHMTLKVFVEQTLRETVSSQIEVIEVQ